MGQDHHYIPKHYLKGFYDKQDEIIWAYEKGTDKRFPASLNNIGHSVNFYTPGKEKYLANEIEQPANYVLDKIRNKHSISKADKHKLTNYIVTLIQRVPASYDRFKDYAKDALREEEEEILSQIELLKEDNPEKNEFYEERKQKILSVFKDFRDNPPRKSWVDIIDYSSLPKVREAVYKKTWQFMRFDFVAAFITSDNPVFFFRGLGLADKYSELVFPISCNIVLWATWRSDLKDLRYSNVNSKVVDEINNRIASSATRHIFFKNESKRVGHLATKEKYSLKRIV